MPHRAEEVFDEDQAHDEADANAAALLSEAALEDWSREEEDAAWAHLQHE